jgi:hypothetical protein
MIGILMGKDVLYINAAYKKPVKVLGNPGEEIG